MIDSPVTSRRWFALVGVVLLGLVAAGCSGGSGSDVATGSDDTAAASSSDAGLSAFRDCLADQGVELPEGFGDGGQGGPGAGFDPENPPAGFDPSSRPAGGGFGGQNAEAFQACAELAPDGFGGGFGPGGPGAAGLEAFDAYVSCLVDNGVVVEESRQGPGSFDRDDPAFEAANETCSVLLPTPSTPTTDTTVLEEG